MLQVGPFVDTPEDPATLILASQEQKQTTLFLGKRKEEWKNTQIQD